MAKPDRADIDHDGMISAEELKQREENIRAWEVLFRDFDEDGNNEISMQEFRTAFNRSFIRVGRGIPAPPKKWAKSTVTTPLNLSGTFTCLCL